MSNECIPVVLTVNEKFLPYARVTIRSLFANSKRKRLDIVIGHYDIPDDAQKRFLESFGDVSPNVVRFLSLKRFIDGTNISNASISARFSVVVFYRLVLHDALPSCGRFIYLDSDVIVKADIADLYDMDMKGNWIAATRGVGFPGWARSDPSRLKWYRERGIEVVENYFNAGILLVDGNEFRSRKLTGELVKLAVESPFFHDQDALNIVCRGHVLFLDFKWNVAIMYCRQRSLEENGAVFADALENGYILHYNSAEKPWNHPMIFAAERWWSYARNEDYGPAQINFYYYNDWPNFGDSLSQKLVEKLSGLKVEYTPCRVAEMMGAGSLFSDGSPIYGTDEAKVMKGNPVLHVWGSGFLHAEIPEGRIIRYRDMVVYAVRGAKTLDALRKVGYVSEGESPALGDPGLLYADLFPECRRAEKKYDVAVIPHRHDQVAALKLAEALRTAGYSVVYVDVMLSEPRDIIMQIAQSRKIVSSSLHGIIVADSLGVPNRRIVFSDFDSCPQCQHAISHFKFQDYYSAFGLEAPAYETEAHVLEDPRGVVEGIADGDCVSADLVARCRENLLAAFPVPENARRELVRAAETDVRAAAPGRRLRVLMVCEPDFLNPFPQHIYNELLEYDLDADCSAEVFWKCDPTDYDIVHIQFPEAFFKWHVDNVTSAEMKRLVDRLDKFRVAGCKIVYTRHNQTVHIPRKGLIDAVYKMLDRDSDGILHMGRYSLMECKGKNPNSAARHYVVPHHTYPHLLRAVDRKACCERLGLDPSRPVVLSFGSFRNQKEKDLVRNAVAECGVPGVQLLAPSLVKGRFVSDHDLPIYFGAADVVFLQRMRILNSGNLPLGFYYGKVVVGPNLCDVGEWLRATGNPVFEAFRPGSEAVALAKGLELAKQGLGAKNREFADREWSVETVTAKIIAAYADLTGRPLIARCGTMQFKRIEIGVATEYLRGQNRLMAANVDKAREIAKLKAELATANVEKAREIAKLKVELATAGKELSAKAKSLQRVSTQLRQATGEVESLKRSESYRLGLLVTWPIRKLYRTFVGGAKPRK